MLLFPITTVLHLGAAASAAPASLAAPAWDTLGPLLQNRMESSMVSFGSAGSEQAVVVILGGNAIHDRDGNRARKVRGGAASGGRAGAQAAEPVLSSIEILRGDSWTPGPAMLEGRTAFAAAVLNGSLYAFGGMASNLAGGVDPNVTATVEHLVLPPHHPAAHTSASSKSSPRSPTAGPGWQPAPPLPYPTTGTHAVTLPGGAEVMLVGGFCSVQMGALHCPGTSATHPWTYTNATLRFDGIKYTPAADLPCGAGGAPECGLSDMALVTCGGKVWAIGGVGMGPAYPDVFSYDVDDDSWTAGPPLPSARSWTGATCIHDSSTHDSSIPGPAKGSGVGADSVMVIGGMDGHFVPSADVWTLPTAGGGKAGWAPGPPLPLPKGFTTAAVESSGGGRRVIVAGGSGPDIVFALQL